MNDNRNIIGPKLSFIFIVLYSLCFILNSKSSLAQNLKTDSVNTTESFDLLIAPPSPAFVLLGIEPNSVERPGTPTDLAISILNNSENLSALPKNYALEIAPLWLFWGENISYDDYLKDEILSNISQSLSLSFASLNDSNSTSTCIGLRTSIIRGKFDNDYFIQMDSIYHLLEDVSKLTNKRRSELSKSDSVLQNLIKLLQSSPETLLDDIEKLIAKRQKMLDLQAESEVRKTLNTKYKQIEKLATNMRVRRRGFKLDFATAIAIDFPGRKFDNSDLSHWGAWLTGGYEGNTKSILSVLRYLGNIDEPNENSLDMGLRIILDNYQRFSLSAESVYRWYYNRDKDKNEYRIALSFDYAIARNKLISFTFGRDFEGKKAGNLLTLINLIFGFGSERPVRM